MKAKRYLGLLLIPLAFGAALVNINPKTPSSKTNLLPNTYKVDDGVAIKPYEEEGDYTVTWKSAKGSSYVLKNGGVLPSKVNENTLLEFKVNTTRQTSVIPKVYSNSVELVPTDGVYSVEVKENITISADDLDFSYQEVTVLSDYYVAFESASYAKEDKNFLRVNKYSIQYDKEYLINGFELKAQDKFKIINSTDSSTVKVYSTSLETGLETGEVDENGVFTCTEDGKYSMYVRINGEEVSAYVVCANDKEVQITGLQDGYTYFAYTWGGVTSGWIEGSYSGGIFSVVLPEGATGFLLGKFVEGTSVSECCWSGGPFVAQTLDITPEPGKVSYTCEWK